jgi:hypothetical protein
MSNNQNKQILTIKNFLDSFKSPNFNTTLNDDFNVCFFFFLFIYYNLKLFFLISI